MPGSCAFCGSTQPLTREHIFGQWLSKIGLDLSPARHKAGPLNRVPREMGVQPPYRQTVKSFCASCNNGWMSHLEDCAQQVLSPLILGKPGSIEPEDQGQIAMWVQKTALTAMLLSSKEQRDAGHGLPQSVYTALYERRDRMEPLDASRFWVGRYDGAAGFSAVRVTPLVVRIPGIPEPDLPQGYLMTVVLGELLLQGLHFTTPALEIDVTMDLGMAQLWPSRGSVQWPAGRPCTSASFLRLADGKLLQPTVEHVELRAWARAAELPQSELVGGTVQVPAACGRHVFHYPVSLLNEAQRGRFYGFMTGCDCPMAYLIELESDGAHCKAAGSSESISEIYEKLPGDEFWIRGEAGSFFFKRSVASTA